MNGASREPSALTWETLVADLPKWMPELRGEWERAIAYWDDEPPPAHVVYGDVVNPHVERLLGERDEVGLKRALDLIEALARNPDPRVQEVAAVTLCECHLGDARFRQAQHMMGPATVDILQELDRFWQEPSWFRSSWRAAGALLRSTRARR